MTGSSPIPQPLASNRHLIRFMAIVCGIAILGWFQARHSPISPASSRVSLYLSLAMLQLIFVWFVNLGIRAKQYSLVSLVGARWRTISDVVRDFALALVFVILLRTGTWFLRQTFNPPSARIAFLLPRGIDDAALWIVVSIVAGCAEEIVYRGYLLRQLWSRTGNLTVALILQALIFGLAHVYQGWWPAALTALYGLAFGALAVWRRSILPGAIAHSAIDMVGGLFPH